MHPSWMHRRNWFYWTTKREGCQEGIEDFFGGLKGWTERREGCSGEVYRGKRGREGRGGVGLTEEVS